MCGVEVLDFKVSNPTTELVVTRRDKASLLAIKGLADVKCRSTYISMVRQVRGIDAVDQ